MPRRRVLLAAGLTAAAEMPVIEGVPASPPPPPTAPGQKVLRYAFPVAETGFDPAQTSGTSNTINSEIFDALLQFAFPGAPGRVRPDTHGHHAQDQRRLQDLHLPREAGLYFANALAFKGRRRGSRPPVRLGDARAP